MSFLNLHPPPRLFFSRIKPVSLIKRARGSLAATAMGRLPSPVPAPFGDARTNALGAGVDKVEVAACHLDPGLDLNAIHQTNAEKSERLQTGAEAPRRCVDLTAAKTKGQ